MENKGAPADEMERLLREQMVQVGKQMYCKGFVVSNDGNISALLEKGRILITPSGVSKGALRPEMMLKINRDGDVLQKGERGPSVETPMHLRAYRGNSNIRAVVHAHPYHATLCSILGIPLDMSVLAEAVIGIGMIPVAGFAAPGSEELAASIEPFLERYSGCLLSNHGVITWGTSLEKAMYQLEQIEFFAQITLGILSSGRQPRLLSEAQIKTLLSLRRSVCGAGPVRAPLGGVAEVNLDEILPRGYDAE